MRTFVHGCTFLFLGLGNFLLWFYWNILYAITKLFFASMHNARVKVCHKVSEVFNTMFTFVLNLLLIFTEWDVFFFPPSILSLLVLCMPHSVGRIFHLRFVFNLWRIQLPSFQSGFSLTTLSIFNYLVDFFISSIFFVPLEYIYVVLNFSNILITILLNYLLCSSSN